MRGFIPGFLLATSMLAQNGLKFDVVSVKPTSDCPADGPRFGIRASPGSLNVTCQTVEFLIRMAYLAEGHDPFYSPQSLSQVISGSPGWVSSEHFSIVAKAGDPQSRETMLGAMMRALLEDRFRLRVHREKHEASVYELTVAEG